MAALSIAGRVLRWQAKHGRSGLPWQHTRDPYKVWLSEVMLQQTQVSTVLSYYPRFLARFPSLPALAQATQDEVLALWSGLGYYSRARNLHRCAQVLAALERAGQSPTRAAQWQALPGVGRSTANAIAAFCWGERAPILDANVRRVLTRLLGWRHDLSQAKHLEALWGQALALCPQRDLPRTMPRYTQGLMDLGATVCTARKPQCQRCPLQPVCVAGLAGTAEHYPRKPPARARGAEHWWLLWAQNPRGQVWLEKRPATGVWAGLYCWPVFDSRQALENAAAQAGASQFAALPPLVHALTHKDLHLHIVKAQAAVPEAVSETGAWFSPAQALSLGLPAPVRRVLAAAVSKPEKL